MEKTLPICVLIDDGFAMHCGAMLASLLTHLSPDVLPDIHILDDGISEQNKERLRSILPLSPTPAQLTFHDVTHINVDEAPKQPDWPLCIYKRLMVASILKDLDRVLLLDADLIILDDLWKLWTLPARKDAWVSGVMDVRVTSNRRRLHLSEETPYLNFGVLLLDLKAFRENKVEKQFREVMEQDEIDLLYMDQDVLNLALNDHFALLPQRWNSQYISDRYTPRDAEDFLQPSIIHYVTKNKPWKVLSTVPRRHFYIKYLMMTPWGEEWRHQMARERWHLDPWRKWIKELWYRAFQLHIKKGKRFIRLFGITLVHDRSHR